MAFLRYNFYNIMCNLYKNISIIFMDLVSKVIWNYNNVVVFCEQKFSYVYNNNDVIKNSVDTINNFFDNSLKSPDSPYWISICRILEGETEKEYYESYKIIAIQEDNNPFINDVIKNDSSLLKDENKNNIILICLMKDKYFVHFDYIYIENNSIELEKTNIQVISIFYSHPLMEDNIQLFIPEKMFIVNNCLFNAAFILRCLKMQNNNYYFDEDYIISIMDSNITEYEIKYNEYLHIGKNDFSIIELKI